MNKILFFIFSFCPLILIAQNEVQDSSSTYKKRVLESTEIEFLSSFYSQTGNNAAVSGGTGSEELIDAHPTIVVSVPLNADDVLTVDAGFSAYSSASSSNVNPFDGGGEADPFQASSGASGADVYSSATISYSHSSDDRNTIVSGNLFGAAEYDYSSFGIGGSYTRLFNEKNTELSFKANAYFDNWQIIYPTELRPFERGRGLSDNFFSSNTLIGNQNYAPQFTSLDKSNRNSFSVGMNFSQILTKNMQMSLSADVVQQSGLLSTPFQRVYFADVDDTFIQKFHLAEDIERLPSTRLKTAIGGRLNYFINERFVVQTFYRFYTDDWGINSHTASIRIPIKVSEKFTVYPSYRFYNQTAADYFAPYNEHLSTSEFYTSDYDLSSYNANQFGFGIGYTDVFTKARIWKFGLKNVNLNFNYYERNSGLKSYMISLGVKFVIN